MADNIMNHKKMQPRLCLANLKPKSYSKLIICYQVEVTKYPFVKWQRIFPQHLCYILMVKCLNPEFENGHFQHFIFQLAMDVFPFVLIFSDRYHRRDFYHTWQCVTRPIH